MSGARSVDVEVRVARRCSGLPVEPRSSGTSGGSSGAVPLPSDAGAGVRRAPHRAGPRRFSAIEREVRASPGPRRSARCTTPGRTYVQTPSTWPSVSLVLVAAPAAARSRSDTPSVRRSSASISLAAHRRVAVRVQQALLGRDQRALAVDGDRAALEHHVRGDPLDAELRRAARPATAASWPYGQELLAPRVEAEVDARRAARGRRRRRSGPESRSQESSIGISTTSTAARACGARPAPACRGAATIVTGSNAAIASAVAAYSARAAAGVRPPELRARRPRHQAALVRAPTRRA